MSFLTEDIFDHRTKARKPFPLRGRGSDWLYASQLPADAARRIRAAIKASRPPFRGTWSVTLLPFIIGVNLVMNIVRTGYGWLSICGLAALLLGPIAVYLLSRGSSGAEIVWSFLAEHRCPCCAYNLAGSEPDPDGRTTCPECGAAWTLPKPASPAA